MKYHQIIDILIKYFAFLLFAKLKSKIEGGKP